MVVRPRRMRMDRPPFHPVVLVGRSRVGVGRRGAFYSRASLGGVSATPETRSGISLRRRFSSFFFFSLSTALTTGRSPWEKCMSGSVLSLTFNEIFKVDKGSFQTLRNYSRSVESFHFLVDV